MTALAPASVRSTESLVEYQGETDADTDAFERSEDCNWLAELDAPNEMIEEVEQIGSLRDMWVNTCRADWMIWYLAKMAPLDSDRERQSLILLGTNLIMPCMHFFHETERTPKLLLAKLQKINLQGGPREEYDDIDFMSDKIAAVRLGRWPGEVKARISRGLACLAHMVTGRLPVDPGLIQMYEAVVDAQVYGTIKKEIEGGRNPKDAKVMLAKEITARFHSAAAADAAEQNADGHDHRESIASGGFVADEMLRAFHSRIRTEQATEHGFAGCPAQPAVGLLPFEPAFREQISDFRPRESTDERTEINEQKIALAFGTSIPKHRADENACRHQRGIRGAAGSELMLRRWVHKAAWVSGKPE